MPIIRRTRHDGWTAERQAIFIATLRISRSITRAARAAGMSRKSAYALRLRPAGARFAAAWDHTLDEGNKVGAGRVEAVRAGPMKVTVPRPAKETKVTNTGQSARAINFGRHKAAHLAPRRTLP